MAEGNKEYNEEYERRNKRRIEFYLKSNRNSLNEKINT
jgi:hypothetical protein